ncbi:MAG TPA: folylpolyglutamate synthase/dihydrofolate synthase family protein [Blastocatellia bacterium]|nr:folylpolyglutamate synthase/dihydrofolate synthase family protein [Blastocatellia bacterium]
MNYSESVSYLYSLGHETLAIKLGLETVRTLARACGSPQRRFHAIHIAGTNGKGSTAAMTESILRAMGRRVGLYTSPHLISITERIRVDGEEIAPETLARLATEVRAAGERLIAEGLFSAPPTFFEQVTIIAFLYFAEREVDLAVLEVGMGGRLDATNICDPVVTVITPIGYDHQEHLGDTLPEIAKEKAGIIKPGIPVVVAPQDERAMATIAARAAELSAPLISVTRQVGASRQFVIDSKVESEDVFQIGRYHLRYQTDRAEYDLRLNLRGKHQVSNALTTIHVAETLIEAGYQISTEAIVEGVSRAEWPGRLELIRPAPEAPLLLLDGAHNEPGVRAVCEFLLDHCSSFPLTLIFGVMADKEIEEMIDLLFPLMQRILVTRPQNQRAAQPEVIADIAARSNQDVLCVQESREALAEALQLTPSNGLICVCGSLFLVGEIKRWINEMK